MNLVADETLEDRKMGIASRKFDEKMADMRRTYTAWPAQRKEKLRSSLEKLNGAVEEMLDCGFLVRVQQEIDFEDEQGNPVSHTVEYSPRILLQAVKAWDANEDFAPGDAATWYG